VGSPALAVARLTWLGHATVVIDLAGVRVLTDPAFTPRLAHLRRHAERVDVPSIGRPDLVLISHVHMDHLHVPSLRMLGPDVAVVVPAGAAAMLRRRGFRAVRETRVGQTIDAGPVAIETVPAVHGGRRGPHSRVAAEAVGYVLRSAAGAVYFPGDTDLFSGMASLAPIDAALLPIWGWGRTLGDGHLNPDRAVQATELLDPRLVIPIHWGTYAPIGPHRGAPAWLREPVGQFESGLLRAGAADRLRILAPGGGLALPAATGPTFCP
jgi:L-ascorbate metabolism protein UlaG (beta-lactamase superfamily)